MHNDQLCQMAQPDRRPAANPRPLKQLAKKWPLVAITNGNAQRNCLVWGIILSLCCALARTGLKTVQRYVLPGGGKTQRADREILHVGDDLTTDVGGAIRSECRPVGSDRKMAI